MKIPTKTLLGLAAVGITAVQAGCFDYLEDFDGHAELSSADTAGWSLVTDTDAPATVAAAFANDDDLNITKLTAANDATSLFDSACFYHEHDIAAGEVVTQGNSAGQDAGDFLLTTTNPATDFGATSIDLRGATFSVDHQHGQEFTSRPVFWFAIVLADGSRWTADDSIATTGGDAMLSSSSDLITTATEFRRKPANWQASSSPSVPIGRQATIFRTRPVARLAMQVSRRTPTFGCKRAFWTRGHSMPRRRSQPSCKVSLPVPGAARATARAERLPTPWPPRQTR